MYHLTPANYCDLKTVLLNRIPDLSDSEIEILIEIFLSMCSEGESNPNHTKGASPLYIGNHATQCGSAKN